MNFAKLDHTYVWHPFTQMRDWLKRKPIVISSGRGTVLRDTDGRKYLDANSSIWTNLHGHSHPHLNRAIQKQLKKISHCSALGLANEPASLLAERLVKSTQLKPAPTSNSQSAIRNPQLRKVFFSDDGSTAMEVALKLAYIHAQRAGFSKRPKFLSLKGAYHGDTVGAVSIGHIDLFHKAYSGLLFKSDEVASPYCYRCPFNRAKPERADAREYRKCNHECIRQIEAKFSAQKKRDNPYAAFVFEPLMQGAAGMIPQPRGWLHQVAQIARAHGAQLIADEVMTAFGRVSHSNKNNHHPQLTQYATRNTQYRFLASHCEGVQPDFVALAKGLTGGYLPMAATLTTQTVFDSFLGDYAEFKTFFHGHSFTGNPLGAAAAQANLDMLQTQSSVQAREKLQRTLASDLNQLWSLPNIGDIRQAGLVAGIELVKDWRTRKPFDLREQAGIRVCDAMARRGVLTRPIGNVIVLMPPLCTTPRQVSKMIGAMAEAICEIFAH